MDIIRYFKYSKRIKKHSQLEKSVIDGRTSLDGGLVKMMLPDFARARLDHLESRDLKFLLENFPVPGRSYDEMVDIIHRLPTTLESLLYSDYVYRAIFDHRKLLLDISPFLLFSVLKTQPAGKGYRQGT